MHILITGGAGYIGSIVAERALEEGYNVLIADNLKYGHREAVSQNAVFVQGDLTDTAFLRDLFHSQQIDAVMHMAAESVVEKSMTDPGSFFNTNVIGGINLINAMNERGCKRLIYSSTAAVYGEPQAIPIKEDHPTNPINAYGESKLAFERILSWYGRANGLKYIIFRYFNAAGASEVLGEGHHPETHLIPNVLTAVLDGKKTISIFGSDYPTKDGSCIRDYVHVLDIAKAHLLALTHLDEYSGSIYNLGNGQGYSVLEIIEMVRNVTGLPVNVENHPRRSGDPPVLVANANMAKIELGLKLEHPGIQSIVKSAWDWKKQHPHGYID